MYLESTDVLVDLDPRLQRVVERKRRGITPFATASTARGEISVIARVDDAGKWKSLSEVRPGIEIALGTGGPASYLVTGRVPASRVEAIRKLPEVKSLKLARPVRPALAASLRETRAEKALLPPAAKGNQGEGVIVGIIDFGCDFAHENFRVKDREGKSVSRILALWDQSAPTQAGGPLGFGKLYTNQDITAALAQQDPYQALGYAPEAGSHGTHVMDIAAGNGGGTRVPGMAPQADIVFVQLSASDLPEDGPSTVNSNFGDSVQLLEAAKFIFDFAGDKPCVVNLSLGTNGGPHDGSSLVEQGLDQLIREKPNRAVVIAASNSHDDGIHASGRVDPNQPFELTWEVGSTDQTSNELELWYSGKDEFLLEIVLPSRQSLGTVGLGRNARVKDSSGQTALFIAHRKQDPNNGDNLIDIFMEAGLPSGTWVLRLHPVKVTNGVFHAWVERDDFGQSTFGLLDNSHTLGSISCGRETLVVGSYDAHRTDTPISFFSSEGPTRDGRQKPEVSAPGHRVIAANATTRQGTLEMSGTSMAAPAVTGIMALALAEARARGLELAHEELRTLVMSSARKNAGTAGWDARFGQGRIDASALVAAVIAKKP